MKNMGSLVTDMCAYFLVLLMLASMVMGDDNPTCEERSFCGARQSSSMPLYQENCFCDDLCHTYGDCCVDHKLRDGFVFDIDQNTLECKNKPKYVDSNGITIGHVYVINKCHDNYTDDHIKDLCHNPQLDDISAQVPVTSLKTHILYKNYYCAKCSSSETIVSKADVKFWYVQKTCYFVPDNNTNVEDMLIDKNSRCGLKFVPPEGDAISYFRRCKSKVIDTCSSDWNGDDTLFELCRNRNHTSYVYTDDYSIFKNIYCARCRSRDNTSCFGLPPVLQAIEQPVMPFSLLFDMNSGEVFIYLNRQDQPSEIVQLPTQHCLGVYNLTTKKCSVDQAIQLKDGSVGKQDDVINSTLNPGVSEEVLYHANVQSWITLIALIISLVCLMISFVAHMLFPPLRNTPGKCVMGLSVSLFVGQLLFLTTTTKTDNYKACFSFGLLMHFAFLASFCWTNCLSFDICKAFSQSYADQGKGKKRYMFYSLYAWLLPLGIVGCSASLDFIPNVPEMYRPSYGTKFCWINEQMAVMITFAGPLALIMLSNLIMFIITVVSICKAKKITKNLKRKKTEKAPARVMDFILYVKLWLIMGLTWVMGLIAMGSNSIVLWYFFIIFNSLQGVFLFLAYVFTKRMKRLVHDGRKSLISSSRSTFKRFYSQSTTSTGFQQSDQQQTSESSSFVRSDYIRKQTSSNNKDSTNM